MQEAVHRVALWTRTLSLITAKATFFCPNLRIYLPQQVRHFLCEVRKQQGLACSRCVKTLKTTRTSVSRGPTTKPQVSGWSGQTYAWVGFGLSRIELHPAPNWPNYFGIQILKLGTAPCLKLRHPQNHHGHVLFQYDLLQFFKSSNLNWFKSSTYISPINLYHPLKI